MKNFQKNSTEIIYVVDDDPDIRDFLNVILTAENYQVHLCSSAEQFIADYSDAVPGCIILDILMTGMDGISLQAYLSEQGIEIPIIFVTGFGDVPTSVKALKSGAIDFLQKPLSKGMLVESVQHAVAQSHVLFQEQLKQKQVQTHYFSLTKREKEVMSLMLQSGTKNRTKQIADQLNISIRTAEKHRANVLQKMAVKSIYDLMVISKFCQ